MLNSDSSRRSLSTLIVLCGTISLLIQAGFAYGADRRVVGELWSQDG